MLHCGPKPQDKEYDGFPTRRFLLALRHRADEGRDAGSANYKARMNLRVA
jgi:hypothetical protein